MDCINIKWEIVQVQVKKENQIIPIDIKLPDEIDVCEGIYLSIPEKLNTLKSFISQAGELSLSFNAKQKHLLHFTAEYNKDLSDKKKSIKLNCQLENNKNITGYYIDYANVKGENNRFLPYTLSIYFECKTIQKH